MITTVKKPDLTNATEKMIAGGFIGLLLIGLWKALPFLIDFVTDLWTLGMLLAPVALIALFWESIWLYAKMAAFEARRMVIDVNPITHIKLYHQYMLDEIKELGGSVHQMMAARTEFERNIKEIENNLNTSLKVSDNWEKRNVITPGAVTQRQLDSEATKIAMYTDQLNRLKPHYETMDKQVHYLQELERLYIADAEDLAFSIDIQEKEYIMFSRMADATGKASKFLSKDSAQYRDYREANKRLSIKVAEHSATLEKFAREAQPIIQKALLGETDNADEGKRLLEEYRANRVLLK